MVEIGRTSRDKRTMPRDDSLRVKKKFGGRKKFQRTKNVKRTMSRANPLGGRKNLWRTKKFQEDKKGRKIGPQRTNRGHCRGP